MLMFICRILAMEHQLADCEEARCGSISTLCWWHVSAVLFLTI